MQDFNNVSTDFQDARAQILATQADMARSISAEEGVSDGRKAELRADLADKEAMLLNLSAHEEERQTVHFKHMQVLSVQCTLAGSQCTCFGGSHVRMLTLLSLLQLETASRRMRKAKQKDARKRTLEVLVEQRESSATGTQVTSLTSTNAQILTQTHAHAATDVVVFEGGVKQVLLYQ